VSQVIQAGHTTPGAVPVQEAVIAQLTELGLTRNEALAYVTLLEEPSQEGVTGYEVASRSGIPRSAVYSVLRRLEESGAAFCTGNKPARYLPTAPDRFVDQMRRSTLGNLERLAETLDRVPKRARPEPIWSLSRYAEVMDRVETMVRGAQDSLYVSIWSRELMALMPALHAIADRRLHRVLHSPDRIDTAPPGFSCWVDDVAGDTEKAGWSHKALVVVDRKEALIGGTEPGADNHAVWTSNPSLVDVATNHIILDITLLSRRLGRDCTDDVSPMMRPHLKPGEK
jgi:sugar-specific transcriptional regulator TrmB